MKNWFLFVLLALASIPNGWSQVDTGSMTAGDQYLVDFNAEVTGDKVLITWTTAKGFSCADMTIIAGEDTQSLETIYVFPGICGEADKEASYSYLWKNPPKNSLQFIKLNLGVFGESSPITVKLISLLPNQASVIPNPGTSASKLVYRSDVRASSVLIELYDATGVLIAKKEDNGNGEILVGDIANGPLSSGTYFYFIELEGVQIRGKFIISE